MRMRKGQPDDVPALADLIHAAVHEGAAAHYDEVQRAAWSPAPMEPPILARRLAPQFVLLAEDGVGLAGVMTLTPTGTLDFAYVRPDRRGAGVAGMLYDLIEPQAMATGVVRLTAFASHMLRPFLLRRGWAVGAPNAVTRGAATINNWQMYKDLHT